MKFLQQRLRIDLRDSLLPLLCYWVVLGLTAWLVLISAGYRTVPAVVAVLLFRRDGRTDPRAFWKTRPARAGTVYLSKAVLFGLGVVLPGLVGMFCLCRWLSELSVLVSFWIALEAAACLVIAGALGAIGALLGRWAWLPVLAAVGAVFGGLLYALRKEVDVGDLFHGQLLELPDYASTWSAILLAAIGLLVLGWWQVRRPSWRPRPGSPSAARER